MKVHLMYKNQDYNLQQNLPWNEVALTQDLELNILFNEMAQGDDFLLEVAKSTVLSGLNNDVNTILYRQNILNDCLKNSSIVRDIYALALESIESERKNYWGITSKYPSTILRRSVEVMQMFVFMLKKLQKIADKNITKFESDGLRTLFSMIISELDDEYLVRIENHLEELRFPEGILVSTELGKGNKSTNYVLRKFDSKKKSWIERLIYNYILRNRQEGTMSWLTQFFPDEPGVYTFFINSRDDSGIRALSELKDEGINSVANSLAQSCDHILGFFKMLRTELSFYIGALNLYENLKLLDEPVSFPNPMDNSQQIHSFKGLYDVGLALTMKKKVVGNDVNADNKNLVIITGANQGGKSTFLRSIGLSQLMMQCGMFVTADSFSANICNSLLTHFKREEDITMMSGKLDEELSRMNDIINNLTPNSIILFNESFAATNEREGSEIATQIVSALLEDHLKVFFVTHSYEFAHGFCARKMESSIFLRAEREADTTRTFKLIEGEPLQTSYGEDLYNRIFGNTRLDVRE